MKEKINPGRVFWIIYFIFLAFIFLTFRDYGTSWDEKYHLDRGISALENFSNPYKISEVSKDTYAVPEGLFFAMLYDLPLKLLPGEENYEALHLVKALFGSLSLIFIYLSLRLIKKDWTQVAAPVLLIFSPRWLGDLFDNHNDIAATLLYSTEIFLSLKLLKDPLRKGVWKWVVVLAIISAISFEHRPGLTIATGIGLILLSWIYIKKLLLKEVTFFKVIRTFSVFTLVFIVALFAVDPYIASHGIGGIPLKAKLSVAPIAEDFRVFYEGKIIYALDLPRDYLPKFMAITTPLITLILLFVGTGFMFFKTVKERVLNLKFIYIFVLASLYLPFTTIIIINPMHFDGWRHLLFLVVPICLIAGIGFTELLAKVHLKVKWLLVGLLVINLGLVTREYILLHPYEYIYFNSLVGGLKGANGRFETDYWGKSVKEATIWLENNLVSDPSKQYKIATCVSTFQTEYSFTPNMYLVDDPAIADFYICPRAVSDKLPDKKPIHEIKREGVPINYIK